jgi:hypothetical protein
MLSLHKSVAGDFRDVHRAADALEPELRRRVLRAFATLRNSVPVNEITDALEGGRISDVLRAVDSTLPEGLMALFAATLGDIAKATARIQAAEFKLAFKLVDERAVRWAFERAGELVVEVNTQSRLAIGDIVSTGLREGTAPRVQARQIRRIVGLTRRDAGAVAKFYQGAVDNGILPRQAGKMSDRYRNRLENWRARNIARTETLRAANQGQIEAWQALADEDTNPLISRQSNKVWVVTPDGRLCGICAPMDGALVQLGELFIINEQAVGFDVERTRAFVADDEAPGGARRATDARIAVTGMKPFTGRQEPIEVEAPPAHPSCRCSVGLQVVTTPL